MTPADRRGRVLWLYCVTDYLRRVVKVGISSNVSRRQASVRYDGITFIRGWLGRECPTHAAFPLVRTWAIGPVTRGEAMAVEALAHEALREVAPVSRGEWFHLPPRVAVSLIEKSCAGRIAREAA